ncbi:hypothetical protein GYMLUDRAFT_171120, partial [Collybiopsis luxurians FD-317 M1]
VADYPEQCLVSCTKYGMCPKCQCKANELEYPGPGPPRTQVWTYSVIKDACLEDVVGGKYEPFWAGLPLMDIHQCIAPDILHQLYQGVFKHLVNWVQEVVGNEELDEWIWALPPVSGVCSFHNGISALTQVSEVEHKHIA